MRDKIIKLLGGYTSNEFTMLTIERDAYKTSSDSLKGQLIQAEKYFSFMHDDANNFKEIVKHQMGMSSALSGNSNNSQAKDPIRTRPLSVMQLMREMREDDAKRARVTTDPEEIA